MSEDRDAHESQVAKTLRLRTASAPVARVSRRALMVASVVLAVGLAGALGWSLMEKRKPAEREPTFTPPQPPEQVSALPGGYVGPAHVPALGPPLPGDLGRPILAASRAKAGGTPTIPPDLIDASPGSATTPLADPRRAAERDARQAAIVSGLFLPASSRRTVTASGAAVAATPTAEARGDARTTSAERLQAPASPYILQAGAIIPAALVTGLRSDVSGLAIAQVTQDVFDSLGGGVLLIPAGGRLIGEYEAGARGGQTRLAVTWTRLILPSGRSIVLDKLPGADEQGMAGLQDGVDRHGRRVLAAAGLSTLLAIGTEIGSSRQDDDLLRALRRARRDTANSVGQQAVGRSLDLAPTLTIRPGAPLRVLLTRDLILEPYVERKVP
ncbi:TrbI/VirB10 family protein [Caulobacter sp. RHG1]|uniref:TrbI/VirB10 family protein n=1 Tax=Caulobacter sp. (strain RHG1) TaxID=2545762 RepID=UPI001553F568|nr:TrbI/VirB10 family protein [Caulobacter sp. RHG1]NQE65349.1 Conjugative transfer protein TrbI [Caulobacter sp. RHG1]